MYVRIVDTNLVCALKFNDVHLIYNTAVCKYGYTSLTPNVEIIMTRECSYLYTILYCTHTQQ